MHVTHRYDFRANAANTSALRFDACVRIGLGRGVCGTAAQQRRTLIVPDASRP